jgi:ADP-glucose pyrophosphorylase
MPRQRSGELSTVQTATLVQGCHIHKAMIGDGCQIKPGCTIKNSIVGLRSKIMANCTIEDCLVMGSDFYETPEDCDTTSSCVPMGIGANSYDPVPCGLHASAVVDEWFLCSVHSGISCLHG